MNTTDALLTLIAESVARVKLMTPEERAAMFDAQRASWVRAEIGMDDTTVLIKTLVDTAYSGTVARVKELQELRQADNIPVKYYHSNPDGSGTTYAVYGTSSIEYVELLRSRMSTARHAEIRAWLDGHNNRMRAVPLEVQLVFDLEQARKYLAEIVKP